MRYVQNTKAMGEMNFLFIQEGKHIVGVCLEFNIIEEGTNLEEVKKHLETATRLHLEAVQENNLSDDLLNRHAPTEYWEIFEETKKSAQRKQLVDAHKRRRLLTASFNPYERKLNPQVAFEK
ncbi:MAG: hypothetical protein KGI78_03050 [Patescibacteria group bacterium]|nr:hypothetical protein [Patescibacteria group bacterium]MDE1944593.1 hypothetical protein [Patescibacteria group bacterium]MDE1945212.1 hypothetical protein [Patescibacteria group bacterium]MDE2057807.1 hypothetical protein [Patescibacteria group bacterium]